jgi:crotonobetainyl-CoA:carnitine CoA-transferase CaiB-like acyl-CoA transferase
VVENFPVGTLGRYGLDFQSLVAQRPADLCLVHRLRPERAVRDKKGYDTVFQAMGGLMSLTGERGGGR